MSAPPPLSPPPADEGLLVIGAGWGRTGTSSLQLALEQLCGGPCHHMSEARTPVWTGGGVRVMRKGTAEFWLRATRGEVTADELRRELAGYRATVDFPTAAVWREVAAAHPGAKIVLSTRDFDAWFDSCRQTLFVLRCPRRPPGLRVLQALVPALRTPLMAEQFARVGLTEPGSRERCRAAWDAWHAAVAAACPPGKLLVWRAADGWAPLCAFLGRPVPTGTPFPRANDAAAFRRKLRLANGAGLALAAAAAVAAAAAAARLARACQRMGEGGGGGAAGGAA